MEKKISFQNKDGVSSVLKSLLCSYLITGILLLILAVLLYRFHLTERYIRIGIIAVYVIATLAGGFLCGKMRKIHKFLWGLGLGILYYVILLAVSFGVYKNLQQGGVSLITTLLLCACGGMFGGMIS